jgi:porin
LTVKLWKFACLGLCSLTAAELGAQSPTLPPIIKLDASAQQAEPGPESVPDPNTLFTAGSVVENAPPTNFWTRPTMTGDWGGLRTRLEDRGISFGGSIAQFAFGQSGGVERSPLPALRPGGVFEYSGRGDYELKFDLEKFGGMPKGSLTVRAQNWFGRYGNVSFNTGSLPPAVFPAALPPVPDGQGIPYITDFFVTQPLSKNWVVYAGKKNVIGTADQDDFAGGNGTYQFMNQAFIANPAFLLGLPYSSFSAGVVSPREWGGFAAFVIDPQDRTQNYGDRLDTLFSEGVIVGGEVKLKTNFFNLPGQQHVGGLWKHRELTDLRFNLDPSFNPLTEEPRFTTLNDSFTIYGGFDQYFQVYSSETKKGWGMFARGSISDGNPTPLRYFLSAGIGGYSPLASRPNDQFGIGWYYTGMSNEFGPLPQRALGIQDGQGIEIFYNVQVNPWMNLTPDFMIINPEAAGIAGRSYIGGLRMTMKF